LLTGFRSGGVVGFNTPASWLSGTDSPELWQTDASIGKSTRISPHQCRGLGLLRAETRGRFNSRKNVRRRRGKWTLSDNPGTANRQQRHFGTYCGGGVTTVVVVVLEDGGGAPSVPVVVVRRSMVVVVVGGGG
jgi:hypothetical protein